MKPHYLITNSRVSLRNHPRSVITIFLAETYSTPGSQIMWSHSHLMWFWESSYSQSMWFENERCYRSEPFMFSVRHTYCVPSQRPFCSPFWYALRRCVEQSASFENAAFFLK